jgi:dihydropteroate synthase
MGLEIPNRDRALVMGVLNVTPDSFFDGGKFLSHEDAVAHAMTLIRDGADIIDVGGESTRPYSQPTSVREELKRVVPVIEGIRALSEIPISIDTYKSQVAREALAAGANMVNDVSGLLFDPEMGRVVSEAGSHVVIMHIKGTPQDMQQSPSYENVVKEIRDYFIERIGAARDLGIAKDRIILDPGIGFGKRVEDNLRILKELAGFRDLGFPLLVGTSMKSFVGAVTDSPLEERLEGTLASVALAVWNGADVVRVHDVKATKKVVKLIEAVKRA